MNTLAVADRNLRKKHDLKNGTSSSQHKRLVRKMIRGGKIILINT